MVKLPVDKRPVASVEKSTTGIKVKFYDKMKALELLGKAVGLFGGAALPDDTAPGLMEAVLAATGEEVDLCDLQQETATGADLVE